MASSSSPAEAAASVDAPALQYRFVSADAVLHRYDRGMADIGRAQSVQPATTYHGLSVTKTFTAAAILQLAQRGLVELDAPPHRYVADLPYPEDITLRQLLTHTAGLPNSLPLRWTHLPEEHAAFDRDAFFRAQFARHPRLAGPPDRRVAYSNLGYQLLGMVIEAVTGERYESYVERHLLPRLGDAAGSLGFAIDPEVHACGYQRRRSLGYPLLRLLLDGERTFEGRDGPWQRFRPYLVNGAAYGGIIGTADGFARYLQLLLGADGGLLSSSATRMMLEEHRLADGRSSGMSLSWFVGVLQGHAWRHHAGGGGGYYVEIRLYPEAGRGSVLLLNRTGLSNANLLDAFDAPLLTR